MTVGLRLGFVSFCLCFLTRTSISCVMVSFCVFFLCFVCFIDCCEFAVQLMVSKKYSSPYWHVVSVGALNAVHSWTHCYRCTVNTEWRDGSLDFCNCFRLCGVFVSHVRIAQYAEWDAGSVCPCACYMLALCWNDSADHYTKLMLHGSLGTLVSDAKDRGSNSNTPMGFKYRWSKKNGDLQLVSRCISEMVQQDISAV